MFEDINMTVEMPEQIARPLKNSMMANFKPKKNFIRRVEAEDQRPRKVVPNIPFGDAFDVFQNLSYKLDGQGDANWEMVASHIGFNYEEIKWIPNLDVTYGKSTCLKFFNYYAQNADNSSVQDVMLALWKLGRIDALKILQNKFPEIDVELLAAERGVTQVTLPRLPIFMDSASSSPVPEHTVPLYGEEPLPPPPGHDGYQVESLYQEEPLNLSRQDLTTESPVDLSKSRYENFHSPQTPSFGGSNYVMYREAEQNSEHSLSEEYVQPVQDTTVDSSSVFGGAFHANVGACHTIGSPIITKRNHPNNIHKPNGAQVQPLRRRRLSPSEPDLKRPYLDHPSSHYPHGITHPSYNPNILDSTKERMRAPDDLEIKEINHRGPPPFVQHTVPRHGQPAPVYSTIQHANGGARPKTGRPPDEEVVHQIVFKGQILQMRQDSSTPVLPGVLYNQQGMVVNNNVSLVNDLGCMDNCSNPHDECNRHPVVHDIQPLYNQGGNQPSVIRGDCQDPSCKACLLGQNRLERQNGNLQKFESPKAMPLLVPGKKIQLELNENYDSKVSADVKHKCAHSKQEKMEFIPHQNDKHLLRYLGEKREARDSKEPDQYAYISRTYPGCSSHSRSPLNDMSHMKHELQRVSSQQDYNMSDFKKKSPISIRVCVLSMDDLPPESKIRFHEALVSTVYDDVKFSPMFIKQHDDIKKVEKCLEKADYIVWCGSARVKQMLEGVLCTSTNYAALRQAFNKSLVYKHKLVRVLFPEQPNPEETFPLQIKFEGKAFLFTEEWDDLRYCLRQPKKLTEKIAKTCKKVDQMYRKPRNGPRF